MWGLGARRIAVLVAPGLDDRERRTDNYGTKATGGIT